MKKLAVPAALVIGLILGFIGKSLLATSSDSASDTKNAELAQLRTENAKLRAELDKPAGNSPSALVKSSGGGDQSNPNVFVRSGGSKDRKKVEFDLHAMQKKAVQQQKERDAKKIALQMTALTGRLGLSDEQQEKVKALLEARAEAQSSRMGRVFSLAASHEGGESPLAIFEDPPDTFDEDLLALLDDDQKTAYAEYLDEKRSNEIEVIANNDLSALQTMFTLSDDQKDKAFDAFTTLAAESVDSNPGSPGAFDPKKMLARRDARLAALEPILTPEQIEVYKDSPNVSGRMVFGTSAFGGSAVIQNIAIDAPATITTEAIDIRIEE